jgi:arylsulfatase A-like enzyme
MYPSFHGVFGGSSCLDVPDQTLAEILKGMGYRTVGISCIPQLSVAKQFHRGFDDYVEAWRVSTEPWILPKLKAKVRSWIRRDELITRYAFEEIIGWLKGFKRSTPFFIFANFNTAHNPYQPPARFLRNLYPGMAKIKDREKLKSLAMHDGYRYMAKEIEVGREEFEYLKHWYDGEIAYLDHILRRLFERLENQSFLKDTLIVLVADHGENFGDHDLMLHQFCLYDTLIRIPMIWHYPEMLHVSRQVSDLVSMVDVIPSILHFTKQPSEAHPQLQGRNLFRDDFEEQRKRDFVVAEYYTPPGQFKYFKRMTPSFDYSAFDRGIKCIRTARYKYIVQSNGYEELYDLFADPREEKNLIKEAGSMVPELRRRLFKTVREFGQEREAKSSTGEDEVTVQKLKALGYL